eukprot:2705853-Prymnesium_polylepis.1
MGQRRGVGRPAAQVERLELTKIDERAARIVACEEEGQRLHGSDRPKIEEEIREEQKGDGPTRRSRTATQVHAQERPTVRANTAELALKTGAATRSCPRRRAARRRRRRAGEQRVSIALEALLERCALRRWQLGLLRAHVL